MKIDVGRPEGCGYTWSNIIGSTSNDGIHPWQVTSPAKNDCIIRVTSLSNTSIYGDSVAFDILSTTTTSVRPTTTTTINRAPTVGYISVTPNPANQGQSVTFTAQSVSDPDGDAIAHYHWGWKNPGDPTIYTWESTSATQTGPAPHTPGTVYIYCIAEDIHGAQSTQVSTTLTVSNRAPNSNFVVSMSPGSSLNVGQTFCAWISTQATDPDGDAVTYYWRWKKPNGTYTYYDNVAVGWAFLYVGSSTERGQHELRVKVIDSHGASSSYKYYYFTVN